MVTLGQILPIRQKKVVQTKFVGLTISICRVCCFGDPQQSIVRTSFHRTNHHQQFAQSVWWSSLAVFLQLEQVRDASEHTPVGEKLLRTYRASSWLQAIQESVFGSWFSLLVGSGTIVVFIRSSHLSPTCMVTVWTTLRQVQFIHCHILILPSPDIESISGVVPKRWGFITTFRVYGYPDCGLVIFSHQG